MDHAQMVSEAAMNVIANHEILLTSPASTKLNSFYPTPSESSSTIAQSVNNSGQLLIQANSKRIGGSADFMISTPNILDVPQLNLSFKVKAADGRAWVNALDPEQQDQKKNVYMCTYHDGWGFDCIDRIEMSVAKSNISNLQLQGHALRDWSLLQCKNADERVQMLKAAGKGKTWTVDKEMVLEASIPLSFLFFRAAGGVKGGFGIDGRTLHGPITFQIFFKSIEYFCGPAASMYDRSAVPINFDPAGTAENPNQRAGAPASINPIALLPTEFERLEISARTYQLMDGIFSVSKALDANPAMTYSIPSLWLNTYTQQVKVSADGVGKLNINSIPAGMLQAIIVRARPVNQSTYFNYTLSGDYQTADEMRTGDYQHTLNYDPPNYSSGVRRPSANGDSGGNFETGVTSAYRPYVPWSLPFDEIRLEYSGQAIYNTRSAESHDNFTRSIFCDDLKTPITGIPLTQNVVSHETNTFYAMGPHVTNASGEDVSFSTNNNVNATLARNLGDLGMVDHDSQVIVIPLCHDGNGVFRKRDFENLPHYSGSTLQLTFKVKPFNTYSTGGVDRQLCSSDGSVLVNDLQFYQDATSIDVPKNLERWKPEVVGAKSASYPSNRLQHVAFCAGPTNTTAVKSIDPAGGDTTVVNPIHNVIDRERVIFNNNPTKVGATATNADNGAGGTIQLDLTYVIASAFQVTNGTSELQL